MNDFQGHDPSPGNSGPGANASGSDSPASRSSSHGAGLTRRAFLRGRGMSAAAMALAGPLPAAFAEFDAQQCGFCTPGFVVAMRAAFDQHPKASPAEIEKALGGNICRCGTYEQMRHAIASLCGNIQGNPKGRATKEA